MNRRAFLATFAAVVAAPATVLGLVKRPSFHGGNAQPTTARQAEIQRMLEQAVQEFKKDMDSALLDSAKTIRGYTIERDAALERLQLVARGDRTPLERVWDNPEDAVYDRL